MADGGIAGVEPRRTEPNNPPRRPPAAQTGADPAAGAEAGKGADPKSQDPLRELIHKLDRTQALVARVDPALASVIKSVSERADVPGRLEDPVFRTRVAYVTQDVEKLVGPIAGMQQGLRAEMARLAATSPGLRNERMQELVRSTPTIDDRTLVRDIRKGASEIARTSDQTSADVQSKVEVLEHRLRLSSRTPTADDSPVRAVAPGQARPTAAENAETLLMPPLISLQ